MTAALKNPSAALPGSSSRLRLGHIRYSNCFPVHARLLDRPAEGDPQLIEGVPSTLNRMLAEREIDVAPSSSIEYALHADTYRVLPDLVIGSLGAVHSIVLVGDRSPNQLDRRLVGLPTASATSVVLLKILLRIRWGVRPTFRWFDQSSEDPFAAGASAALFIGDVALRADLHPERTARFDLGLEWWEETGLPFAFAIWQVSEPGRNPALRDLHARLLESRTYGEAQRSCLAKRYATEFNMPAAELERYWNGLSFDLDQRMVEGLRTFYELAHEIGEIPRAPALRWLG